MADLLKLCKRVNPSHVWKELRNLEYESDYRKLTKWLEGLLATEPPPKEINGMWFGLFNPYLDDGKPTSCLYLAGSERFDSKGDDPDWACGPEYFPEGRYSHSSVLTTIYRTVSEQEGGVGSQGEYTLCLGYACLVVGEWCRGPMRKKLLGTAASRGVSVGFDSGDAVLVDILERAEA
jgi:hypothetical protein